MLASRLQTLVKTKGTILDRWLADRQEWAPIALRVPLGMIFFAHGAQKMFGWFGGYGWNGTMQYFTQSLHIPARLSAGPILVELFGGLSLLARAFPRWTAILPRGLLLKGWVNTFYDVRSF